MSTDHLPSILRRAFDRMKPEDLKPVPAWPRSVRLGVDYAVRVAVADIKNDEDANTIAWFCCTLGELARRDPPGDPPATCAAHDKAEHAGPEHARAFALLGAIRDASTSLAASGIAVRALPEKAMKLLQKAARGERISEPTLLEVLDAAEELAGQLGSLALRRLPGAV